MNASASTSSLPEEKVQAITIPPWSKKNAWALLATFILATAVFFNGIGSFPLFNPDEALYAEPAREMLKNGDYLTTHLNYIVRYTKPPLVIWAQAFLFSLFGVSEGVARSFGAACGVRHESGYPSTLMLIPLGQWPAASLCKSVSNGKP